MLRIWGRITSVNVQKVVWTADELGIAYERRVAGGAFGIVATPEYRRMNPNLAPAPMVGDALLAAPKKFLGRLLLAAPMPPPDPGARQTAEFFRIREKYSVGDRHRSFQLLACAGVILLEEGLKRSGRGVTREKLVASLGNIWQFQTGVTPPLTYGANRRAGAAGAAILRVGPATGQYDTAAVWREPQ